MYASDITRTLPVSGKFTARQREIYDIVLGAQQAAIDAFSLRQIEPAEGPAQFDLRRGLQLHSISHGKDLHGEAAGKVFHFTGLSHAYVGLNVHDGGDYKHVPGPAQGAVFTIRTGNFTFQRKMLGVAIGRHPLR
jgi:Xaa-Pro aminopeptidase